MSKRKSEPDPQTFLPLTPVVFDILLSLVDEERHGYAVMQEVSGRLLPGTLYRALSRLLENGLVEASEQRPDPELDDERRRYYRLTELGRRVIEAEAQRLAEQVRAARAKKLIPGTKRV